MIRTNLSTRPFYHERAVHLWLLVIAALVVAATVYNVSHIVRYSRSDQDLARQASTDESRAAEFRQQAEQLRATVDPNQVERASLEAGQANDLIDRRTFSWTELLNRLETTLPDDVHVIAIRPRITKDKRIVLLINVVAKSIDDTFEFVKNLQQTGAFKEPYSADDRPNDQGLMESMLQMYYIPAPAKPPESTGVTNP